MTQEQLPDTDGSSRQIPPFPRTESSLNRVRFIMVCPSHPGNVGATARALKTMGIHDLYLVSPKLSDITQHPEAVALASGATDVLSQVRISATLEAALENVTLAFALTARARALGPPPCDVRNAAGLARTHLEAPGTRMAIVLGTERAGLTNEHIGLCHHTCHIPANPDYSSLNVSQAAQLAAWELRYALLDPDSPDRTVGRTGGAGDPGATPASSEKVQALMTHWEQALIATGFLNPAHPKKLMPRMRHLFSRCGLSQDEVDMLRGLCTAILRQNTER